MTHTKAKYKAGTTLWYVSSNRIDRLDIVSVKVRMNHMYAELEDHYRIMQHEDDGTPFFYDIPCSAIDDEFTASDFIQIRSYVSYVAKSEKTARRFLARRAAEGQ